MTVEFIADRACEYCNLPLVRKQHADGRFEHLFKFRARRFCDPVCAVRGRSTGPCGHGEQIRWEPIIADPPTEDRCWAGQGSSQAVAAYSRAEDTSRGGSSWGFSSDGLNCLPRDTAAAPDRSS